MKKNKQEESRIRMVQTQEFFNCNDSPSVIFNPAIFLVETTKEVYIF